MARILKDFYLLEKSKNYSLREILEKQPKSLIIPLPIKGGWGYSKEGAIIIDKNDEVVNKNMPFDGVGLEYVIVKKRLNEELIYSRNEKEACSSIKYKLKKQSLLSGDKGRMYDYLIIEGTCFILDELMALKKEVETSKNIDYETLITFPEKLEALQYYFTSEYYFDITSFFGQ